MYLPECVNSVSGVPGLFIWEEFLSMEEESAVLQGIEAQPWSGQGTPPNPEIRRRTQQYGHLFSFRTRKIAKKLGPLPSFVDVALERMIATELFPQLPDLLIINEYETGQGIMPHIDAPTFGPVVTSLSLLSACVMSFALKQDVEDCGSKTHVDVLLRT
ncbi:hypothetical protein HDU85_001810 [Gaertneriomyces sp. JEL0708]|nr:hypothetical protein HDU85_001810 [Gaertneriomyces sp. JEL0708]